MQAYRIAAAGLVLVGGTGAALYGTRLGLSGAALWGMLAAFVLEAVLYLSCGFDAARRAWPKWLLAASAVLPYALYTLPLGLFSPAAALELALLAAAVVWWFDIVPEPWGAELLLLIFLAAVYLARLFPGIYPDVHPRVPMATLGHLLWVRLALTTLLNRRPAGIDFGFIPTARQWRIGAAHFLAFLPAGALVMWLANYGSFALVRGWWYKAALGFAGGMLLVAASEEVLFRGMLQRRFVQWWGEWPGLIAASFAFGLVHLPYRHQFPNWQHVALTFVLALFVGRAYHRTQGVRAAMVVHALAMAAGRAVGM
jgi:membrane protease YdiL (CAAX protease family)